ncbi:cyclic lactone autoinducer peptide [Romboutsia weinsteinii]|nr:cyclic lactone autoinducer peptide [Romboutsia weinsteinii]
MNFLFNSLADVLNKVAQQASTRCAIIFFEQEVPKSLREE